MSTLSRVSKGLSNVAAPQLIGADYRTGSNEFWMFNQEGGYDYKFSYSGHHSSLKAFKKCPPLSAVILKKTQAFANGKTWILNKKGKAKEKESTNPIAEKVRALLAKPNPFQSQKEFEAQLYAYIQVFGFCFVLPIKPVGFPNTDAGKLWNIPPSMVDIEESRKSWLLAEANKDVIKYLVIDFAGEKTEIPLSDVFIFTDFTPTFHSPVFPEGRTAMLEFPISNIIGALETRGRIIDERGPQGIISSDSKDSSGYVPIQEEQKEEMQKDFLRYGMKRQQWQYIITSASVKFTQVTQSTRELMLFEEIEDDTMMICDGYNYPYRLLSSDKTNSLGGSDLREWKKELYEGAIVPEAENISEQWNKFFDLEKYGLVIQKDYTHIPCMQDDEQKKASARKTRDEAMQIEFLHNLCTMDEWRVANNDDPVGGEFGGKKYYELINLGWKFGSTGATLSVSQTGSDKSTIA